MLRGFLLNFCQYLNDLDQSSVVSKFDKRKMKLFNSIFVLSALLGVVMSSPAPVSDNLEYRVSTSFLVMLSCPDDMCQAIHELEKRGCVSEC